MFAKGLARAISKSYSYTPASAFSVSLKQKLTEIIPKKQAELKEVKEKYGKQVIGDITVDKAIGGMRDMHGLLWDASLLDPIDGIKFKGFSIPDLVKKLQKAPGGHEPLPEGLLWLLLTGEVPNDAEFKAISEELKSRSQLSHETEEFIKHLPHHMHPMTQLSAAMLHLQTHSKFAKAYRQGVHKSKYWDPVYEDCMDLIAKIPRCAALIYRHLYKGGEVIAADTNLDWGANYSHMMGYDQHEIKECIRGYLTIHSDHEGGNVSAHTSHLVGSALADPYLSYSAALNGLAGPLHGLANQEVLRWLLDLQKELGNNITDAGVREFTQRTLGSGKVIPGYGHAVLRNTDPRYIHQREFAIRHIKDDSLVELCKIVFNVVPPLLKELGKVKNPWPNVDAHSGVLLYHYGITEFDYYTVVFAVSRALGCMSNLFWSRAFGLPIERPLSITLDWVKQNAGK